MINGTPRKTDTESTQFSAHDGVTASTVTATGQPALPKPPTDPNDILPLSFQTTHHLVKGFPNESQPYGQSPKLSGEKPYAYYGIHRYPCIPPCPFPVARPLVRPRGVRCILKDWVVGMFNRRKKLKY